MIIATLTYKAKVDAHMYRYLAQDLSGEVYAYASIPCIDDMDGVWCAFDGGAWLPHHCQFILCGEENNHPQVSLVDLFRHAPVMSKGALTPGDVLPVGPPSKVVEVSHTVEIESGGARYLMQDIDGYVWTTRDKPELSPGGYWDGFGSDEPRYVIMGISNLEPGESLIDLATQEFTFEGGILRRAKQKGPG